MEKCLTINQREYVLYHLAFSADISSKISSSFVFGKSTPGKICFMENDSIFDESNILNIDNCPILFPGAKDAPMYSLKNGTLVFHHDLLKSAFYLLSGYQEYGSNDKDSLGRFAYESSLQHKLGIINRPLVNEYFEFIHQGILLYCSEHNIEYTKPKPFKDPVFFLTHDVDRIDKYTFHTIKGKLKRKKLKTAFVWFLRWVNPFYKKNPRWSYDYLCELEKKREIRSTFFFLNRGVKHIDSYYSFKEERIRNLIARIEKMGSEIGLHGSIRTEIDLDVMQDNLRNLNEISAYPIRANRQHRLLFKMPQTMVNLEICGFVYDTSLGFAAHEGFRNSYCLPFKLFNFENDKMINVWEIPMNIMDVSLFDYRKLNYREAKECIIDIITKVKKYNGVLTLLFHPETFDEEERPGITKFYESILDLISNHNFQVLLPMEFLEQMNLEV